MAIVPHTCDRRSPVCWTITIVLYGLRVVGSNAEEGGTTAIVPYGNEWHKTLDILSSIFIVTQNKERWER